MVMDKNEIKEIRTEGFQLLGIGAAWWVAILALVLVTFSIISYAFLARAIRAATDASLSDTAREFAAATQLGGMLDLCSDRVVEFAVITGIAWRCPELYFPALILVGTWYVNITAFLAAGAALERCGPKLIDYPPGLVERAELIIFFVFLAMLPRQFGPWLCYAYSGLELITATQRLLYARRMLSARSNP